MDRHYGPSSAWGGRPIPPRLADNALPGVVEVHRLLVNCLLFLGSDAVSVPVATAMYSRAVSSASPESAVASARQARNVNHPPAAVPQEVDFEAGHRSLPSVTRCRWAWERVSRRYAAVTYQRRCVSAASWPLNGSPRATSHSRRDHRRSRRDHRRSPRDHRRSRRDHRRRRRDHRHRRDHHRRRRDRPRQHLGPRQSRRLRLLPAEPGWGRPWPSALRR
jgi:hypothetical protein